MLHDRGFSVLMLAVEKGNDSTVNLLIQAGADVNKKDKNGDTALIYAVQLGNICCLNLLIQAGANVNKCNNIHETALMFALVKGHIQCVAPLITAGANVNQKTQDGTALWYALCGRNDDCVRLMIEAGADRHGSLLMYNIITKTNPGTLLEHGIDSNIKMLSRVGALVNNTADDLLTLCLLSQRKPPRKRELALLLFAAGEKFRKDSYHYVEYLRLPKQKTLKYLCSETIRTHLLERSNVNLFYKMARLGLPPALSKFLLYEQSVSE